MNREDIIRMADEAGITPWEKLEYIGDKKFSSTDEGLDGDLTCLIQFATLVAAAEREKFQPILDAAQGVIDWTESKFREPVRDELEFGRMVYVRLHALADLYDAIRARGQA